MSHTKSIIKTITDAAPRWTTSGGGKPFAFVDDFTLVDNTDGTITVYQDMDGDAVYVSTVQFDCGGRNVAA